MFPFRKPWVEGGVGVEWGKRQWRNWGGGGQRGCRLSSGGEGQEGGIAMKSAQSNVKWGGGGQWGPMV